MPDAKRGTHSRGLDSGATSDISDEDSRDLNPSLKISDGIVKQEESPRTPEDTKRWRSPSHEGLSPAKKFRSFISPATPAPSVTPFAKPLDKKEQSEDKKPPTDKKPPSGKKDKGSDKKERKKKVSSKRKSKTKLEKKDATSRMSRTSVPKKLRSTSPRHRSPLPSVKVEVTATSPVLTPPPAPSRSSSKRGSPRDELDSSPYSPPYSPPRTTSPLVTSEPTTLDPVKVSLPSASLVSLLPAGSGSTDTSKTLSKIMELKASQESRVRLANEIPSEEYERLRRQLTDTVHDVFRTSKPHSQSKILLMAKAATEKSYLYKAAEKIVSRQIEKCFDDDFKGLTACFFLINALLSRAREKYGKNKERFSVRLLPLVKNSMARLFETEPNRSQQRTLKLQQTKRDALRLLKGWIEKKVFPDVTGLSALVSKYQTAALDMPKQKSRPTQAGKKSKRPVPKPASSAASPPSPPQSPIPPPVLPGALVAKKGATKVAEAANPAQVPVPDVTLFPALANLMKKPIMSAAKAIQPPVLPFVTSVTSTVSTPSVSGFTTSTSVGNGMDLESTVRALTQSGLTTPVTAAQLFAALSTVTSIRDVAPNAERPGLLLPPQLPVYTNFADPLRGRNLIPSLPPSLQQLPSALPLSVPMTASPSDDELASFYKDVAPVLHRPTVPPRSVAPAALNDKERLVNQRIHALENRNPLERLKAPLGFWIGFLPKLQEKNYAVVTNMLSTQFLPRNGNPEEDTKALFVRTFKNFGKVAGTKLHLSGKWIVVTMENRFQANRAKRYIFGETNNNARPVQINPAIDEANLMAEIREKKIALEWHPTDFILKNCLKYWNFMDGVAQVPWDAALAVIDGRYGLQKQFDKEKFRQFVRDHIAEGNALIVPESFPTDSNSSVRGEVYREVVQNVHPEMFKRSRFEPR